MNEKYKVLLIRIIFILLFFIIIIFSHLSMKFEFHSIKERICVISKSLTTAIIGLICFINPSIAGKAFFTKDLEDIYGIEFWGLIFSIISFEYVI
ncbi:hypothetical protein [Tepidibacter hydrothermalis]|uniref:Uncharacterized protein n=1 Tax=Tepidibacter hydrothermalis TaxID=3036126 RepID=A0ABY8EFT7_9FIRM|nr:hypothetical protein [Tepidibacter hydrothermalis]WFD10444.1 hypothetical protein P4S50_19645 [Tepidibacter hydrothermalis]